MNLFDLETAPELREQILKYFASSTMTDVERAKLLGLPEGCRIREGAKIISPENLKIGKNVWIGENAILDASGGLEIGDNTQIGLGVLIWTHHSYVSAILGHNTKSNKKYIERQPTKIGSNCAISGPTVIMSGVTIGNKCLIAPMSVVHNDVKSNSVFKPYDDLLKLKETMSQKIKHLESEVLEIKNMINNQ